MKVAMLGHMGELATYVGERHPGLDVEQAFALVEAVTVMAAGFWTGSRPSPVIREVYAAHPGLAHDHDSFRDKLEFYIAALVAGIPAVDVTWSHRS